MIEMVDAIRTGDTRRLSDLLRADPALVKVRPDGARTMLHIATDWPGHFPNVASTIHLLSEAGADPDAPFNGAHCETPLHWAASSGDLDALTALLDAGASIESPGSVIGGGTPLAGAVAFAQWSAARCLVERGAKSNLWQAAALGLHGEVERLLPAAAPDTVTNAFWCACHGGQRGTAEMLLAAGADLNWVGHDGLTPLDAARRSGAESLAAWLVTQGARARKDLK